MTTINLVANDQRLFFNEKPFVATGDVNSLELHVNFDSVWDGYGKEAVFFTEKKKTPKSVVLVDNKCNVPSEFLCDPCYIYIGIRGVHSDERIKTTTIVKFKLAEGTPTGENASPEPTPEKIDQLLSAHGNLKERMQAFVNNVEERMQAFINDVEELMQEVRNYFEEWMQEVRNYFESRLSKNLTTTEEGFALDATQGKILNDSINELNKNLDSLQERTILINYRGTDFQTFTVDISPYRFLTLELWFNDFVISQIMLPKDKYLEFRNISGFVDSTSNIGIGYLQFTSNTSLQAKVTNQINNTNVYIKLFGIK